MKIRKRLLPQAQQKVLLLIIFQIVFTAAKLAQRCVIEVAFVETQGLVR